MEGTGADEHRPPGTAASSSCEEEQLETSRGSSMDRHRGPDFAGPLTVLFSQLDLPLVKRERGVYQVRARY